MVGEDDAITVYDEQGLESGRLFDTATPGPLELARTTELLDRVLPAGPLSVLDVGGGAGADAVWLRERGHSVRLVEPSWPADSSWPRGSGASPR